ncbi:hypothetical protein [Aliivibrio logei]|uniref:hypothetical protein n=1 Tax=Aliivibrio logei TaxID=688 RepID=UPI0035C90DEB
MNFGNVCIKLCARICAILLILTFKVNASSLEDSQQFKAYENKSSYCRQLSKREIKDVTDIYFNSLDDEQKRRVLGILYFKALDKCVAYEEAAYFKFVIRTQDEEGLKTLKMISHESYEYEDSKVIIKSLDKKEIERLSNTEVFSTPFDVFSVFE